MNNKQSEIMRAASMFWGNREGCETMEKAIQVAKDMYEAVDATIGGYVILHSDDKHYNLSVIKIEDFTNMRISVLKKLYVLNKDGVLFNAGVLPHSDVKVFNSEKEAKQCRKAYIELFHKGLKSVLVENNGFNDKFVVVYSDNLPFNYDPVRVSALKKLIRDYGGRHKIYILRDSGFFVSTSAMSVCGLKLFDSKEEVLDAIKIYREDREPVERSPVVWD